MTTATAACCEHITKDQIASEQETLRRNLAQFANGLTNNGATIAQFLHDTVQGEYPDAKFHHRERAAVNLAVMSGQLPEDVPGSLDLAVTPDPLPGFPEHTTIDFTAHSRKSVEITAGALTSSPCILPQQRSPLVAHIRPSQANALRARLTAKE